MIKLNENSIDSIDIDKALENLSETLDEQFIEIIVMLHKNFKSTSKVRHWLYTENLNFGGISPMELIMLGRGHKVKKFIKSANEGNLP